MITRSLKGLALCAAVTLLSGCESSVSASRQPAPATRDVQFIVIVKSSNHQQSADGTLTLLNYHFFSEVFLNGRSARSASLARRGGHTPFAPYVDRGKTFYFEGGHFTTLEEADRAYPNGTYDVVVDTVNDGTLRASLDLTGPDGKTDIPAPITIRLSQDGQPVSPTAIDASRALEVRWSAYSNGRRDPKGIVDDMIFVVVADCRGNRIVHTGLPFGQEEYLRFDASGITIDRGKLTAGEPYSMFVEFPHVADSTWAGKTPAFASFATATYLDLRTQGDASTQCPKDLPPMDTGQTNRAPKPQ